MDRVLAPLGFAALPRPADLRSPPFSPLALSRLIPPRRASEGSFIQGFFHSDDGFLESWISRIHGVESYMEPSKIVMRYADGRILKGYTKNFDPDKPTFFLYKGNPETFLRRILVSVEDLKAYFLSGIFWGTPSPKNRGRSRID